MIDLQPFLSVFQNFDFLGCSGEEWRGGWGLKGQKWSKMTKNSAVHHASYSGTVHHVIVIYGTHV